jgi:integrase
MNQIDLPYVNAQRDRAGRVIYFYFRRSGRRWRLPPLADREEFMAEYARLLAATAPSSPTKPMDQAPRSFGALAAEYFADKEAFGQKSKNTRRIYRIILEPLVELHGNKPVALLERRHVKAWRDARGDTPGMANMVVKVMRVLLAYAVENEYRKDNPAHRIKLFKLGEHRAWTDDECATFEKRWPPDTMQRRAYMLARYTGQRCGDLARMTRAHCKDGAIRVMQQKTTDGRTNEELWIPLHRDLAAELALGGEHMSYLTRADGSAFDSNSLGIWFAGAIEQAGLHEECVLHGLRKTAARMLAEVGCGALEIMAITGHRSLPEVQRYVNAANQKILATAAIPSPGTERKPNREWQTQPQPEWQTKANRLILQGNSAG